MFDRKIAFGSRANLLLLSVLVLLFFEEIVAVYIDSVLGLFLSFFGTLATAALAYAAKGTERVKDSMQCFSLIFLSRVTIAVVPALVLPFPSILVIIYSIVLVSCTIYAVERGLTAKSLGFRFSSFSTQVLGGLALGAGMGVTEFAILSSDIKSYLLFERFSIENLVYVALIMFLLVGFGEELLFRGLTQTSFEKELGNKFVAMIGVSLIFAIMHLGYVTTVEKLFEIAYVFIAATAIGYSFMKTNSLVLPLIAHGTANTILFGILPYLL